ncbi:hypothetical protein [Dyadobacter helix]|nr:hypothetical protein [Dyadobacter sp. CECT 9275]
MWTKVYSIEDWPKEEVSVAFCLKDSEQVIMGKVISDCVVLKDGMQLSGTVYQFDQVDQYQIKDFTIISG